MIEREGSRDNLYKKFCGAKWYLHNKKVLESDTVRKHHRLVKELWTWLY